MRGAIILAIVLVATIAPATCQRPWWRGQAIKRLGLGQQQFRPNGQRQQQFRPNNQWMQPQDPEAAQEMQEQMAEQAEREAEAAEELREQEEERAQEMQEQQLQEQQNEYEQENVYAAQGIQQQDTEEAQELAEQEAEEEQELAEQEAEAEAEAAQNMQQTGQEMEQEQDPEAAQELAEQEAEAAQELAEQEAEAAEEEAEAAEELREQEAEEEEAEAEAMEELEEQQAEAAEAEAEAMGEQGEAAEGAGEGQGGSVGTSFSFRGSQYGSSVGTGPSFSDPIGGYGGSGGSGGSVSFAGSSGGYQGYGGQNGGQGGAMGAAGGAGGATGDIPGGGNIGEGAATGGVATGATNGVNNGTANGAAPNGAANSPSSGSNNGATSGGATSSGASNPTKGGGTNGVASGATGGAGSTGMNGNGGVGSQGTEGTSQGSTSRLPSSSGADGVGQNIGSSFTETTNLGARNEPNIAFAPAPIKQSPDAQLTPAETAALDNTYMDRHLCGGFLGANGISGKKGLAVLALDYAGMSQALNPCNVPENGRTSGRTPVNIAFRSGLETHGQDPASAVLRDLPGMIQRYQQTPRKVHLFSWHMPSEHALRSLLTKKRRGGLANVEVVLGYVEESKMALFSALLGDTTFTNLLGQLQQAGISVNRLCDTCSQIVNMTNWQRKRQGLVNGIGVFDQQAGQCGPVTGVPATDQLALSTPQCQSFQESMGSCVLGQLTAVCPWLRHAQAAGEQPLAAIMQTWSTECGKNLSCWQEKGGYLSFLARTAASCRISQYGASSAIGQCVGAGQNAPLDPAPATPSM